MTQYLTAALYKFVSLPDYQALQAPILAACLQHRIKGTLLLASEGINGTIAGAPEDIKAILAYLRLDPRLSDLEHKESYADTHPFYRMKVKLKKEIVTMGIAGINPNNVVGTYVKPEDWNALISDPDVVVLDTRNDYEVSIGTFKGAVDPKTTTFREFPNYVEQHLDITKHKKVAMFCTGGIRCEKASSYMKQQGFEEVYHLQGGILKYLETVPKEQSLWQGECFVFDERVSVGHGLKVGPYELCRSCRHPVGDIERASPHYQKGVSCPRCHESRTPAEKAAMAERQRQVELARARGQAHVGAKMPQKPRRLADPLAHLLGLLQAPVSGSDGPTKGRILIALAGLPGSGKSTLANKLAQEVNVKMGAGTAIALGMDGFHLTRAQLASLADPAEALKRRGASWTFDMAALAARLKLLQTEASVAWPGYDHGLGDPVEGAMQVRAETRLVIVEGLYLLHQGDGWNLGELFRERWYLDTPLATAMARLIERHMRANGNSRAQAEQRLAQNDRLNAQIVASTRNAAHFRLAS